MNPIKLFRSMVLTFFLVLLTLFTIVFWLPVRLFVQLLAKLLRKDLEGMLDPAAAAICLYDLDKTPKFNLTCFMVYDGQISVQSALEYFAQSIGRGLMTNPSRKLEYHRLRTPITTFCGYFFWKRAKDFQITNHLHAYEDIVQKAGAGLAESKKPPIKAVYGEEDLKKIADYLSTRNWKRDQSPWETVVLNNFQSEGTSNSKRDGGSNCLQTVVILRAHHALGDGYSFVHLLANLHGYQGEFSASPTFPKHSVWQKLLFALLLPMRAFRDVGKMLYQSQVEKNEWVDAPRDGTLSNSYITTWSPEIPVERIKNIKNRFDVSFFAVLESATAGVLAKMMKSTGAEVPAVVRCFVPIPLPNHPRGLHIHANLVVVELLTGEADPVDRLLKTHSSTVRLKESVAPIVTGWLIRLFCNGPNFFIHQVVNLPGHTVEFSPFPGFASQLQITPEHVVRRFFFSLDPPPTATAVGCITSFTNWGNLIFACTIRRHLISSRKQVEQFTQFIEEELCALEKAHGPGDFMSIKTQH